MLVLGGALACLVALPLCFMSLVFAVDSVSPFVDTARSFTATFGCIFLALATVSLLPLAGAIATLLREALRPRYAALAALGSFALTLPALVDGTRNDAPPAMALFALGAIGLAVAATILLALRPAGAFAAVAVLSLVVLVAALTR